MNRFKKPVSALLAAAALTLGITGCAPTSPSEACKIDQKDRSTSAKGASIYRVYTSCGVFNVEDAALLGQFNAADTYAKLQVGKTYQLTTYGYRNGFLSIFPNITAAKEL